MALHVALASLAECTQRSDCYPLPCARDVPSWRRRGRMMRGMRMNLAGG